jgi:AraC-like DNA-binding protein
MSVAPAMIGPSLRTVSGGLRVTQPEASLSVRLLWPFARVAGADDGCARLLAEAGVGPAEFTDPDTRVPHRVVVRLLDLTLRATGDPAIGLHAAEATDAADLNVLVYAARNCATLREAIACTCRYFRLLNDAAELVFEERQDRAWLTYRVCDGVEEPPSSADFAIATLVLFGKQHVASQCLDAEVWLTEDQPTHLHEHLRVLGPRVFFGAPSNSIVFPRHELDSPMRHPDPRLARAFQRRAEGLLRRVKQREGVGGQVRELVANHLGSGVVTMEWAAKKVAMSVPTLRRRLADEGTTFRELLDDIRRQLAERQLAEEPATSVTELAFVLGFSDVASFCRAFKRWNGIGPTEFRTRLRG